MLPKNTHTLLLIVAIMALALSACAPLSPISGGVTSGISVSGNGVVYGTPDIAIAQIGVQTRHADPSVAVSQNNAKMSDVTAALVALGIEEKDIQTTNFSVYAQHNYDMNGQPTDLVYVVDNTVSVTVRDLTKVGAALGQAVDSGANNIFGVTYSVSDVAQLEQEARTKAMADAKTRAEQLAREAGVALGEATSIIEYSSPPVVTNAFASYVQRGGGGDVPAVPVSSGQIQITLQVNVTYTIK